MGKPTGKKKPETTPTTQSKTTSKNTDKTRKSFDEDTVIFITMSHELKEEGNKLFHKKDHEGAMLKYEKALKLLPSNHIDVASLHTSMAQCYMQLGHGEYPRAINECNLALQVAPKYSKALLRRARCFLELNQVELAWRDVCFVLSMEPNNQHGLELREELRVVMEEKGVRVDELDVVSHMDTGVVPVVGCSARKSSGKDKKMLKDKLRKKRRNLVLDEGKLKQVEVKNVEGNGKVGKMDQVEVKKVEGNEKGGKFKQVGVKKVEGNEKGGKFKQVGVKKVEGNEKGGKFEQVGVKNVEGNEKKADKRVLPKSKHGQKEVVKHEVDDESKPEDKEVVQEKVRVKEVKRVTRTVKLVYGDDIRSVELPVDCGVLLLRDVVKDRFPGLEGTLVKYKDHEGDLVTITSANDLRKAEGLTESNGSLRLYVSRVSPDQELVYEGVDSMSDGVKNEKLGNGNVGEKMGNDFTCIDSWIIHFAQLFKTHVGIDPDSYLDLHEVGMKLYSEAIEDAVSSEEAQELFDLASEKFKEMAALALFNIGNVHMCKARKHVPTPDDNPDESMISTAYEWTRKEYCRAGARYEEALKIKPDFYEGHLALGLQQFDLAKLGWGFLQKGKIVNLQESGVQEILLQYNKAEDCMEAGMHLWEEMEERRLNGLCKEEKYKAKLRKMGLDRLINDLSPDAAREQADIIRSQIYILWGTLLYERSVVEFSLDLPTWEECLEVAVEKFELAGASETDITVMIKNHCSNQTAPAGLGFKIDEIVQAWNEMYDAQRWQLGVPSFRLEPLFRRRVPRIHQILEHL